MCKTCIEIFCMVAISLLIYALARLSSAMIGISINEFILYFLLADYARTTYRNAVNAFKEQPKVFGAALMQEETILRSLLHERGQREVDSMENADVQKMFQVNALLASMPANDPHREMLVQALHAMKCQFISENMVKKPEEEMDANRALDIVGDACKIASAFEAKALGEEAVKNNAIERATALSFLVDALNKSTTNDDGNE